MNPINIMIVDDHPFFRQGLRDVLGTDKQFAIVAEAYDGQQAIDLADVHKPDIILMDINLPTLNGLQATRHITTTHPDSKVITITGYDDAQQVFHAFRAGASAYCPKDIMPDVLIKNIHQVHRGLYAIGERIISYEELMLWLDEKLGVQNIMSDNKDIFVPLSPREMEILEHVTYGFSNKEIALHLKISHQTVKNHMTAILKKLGVDDRTQAAVYALSNGWVRLTKRPDKYHHNHKG